MTTEPVGQFSAGHSARRTSGGSTEYFSCG